MKVIPSIILVTCLNYGFCQPCPRNQPVIAVYKESILLFGGYCPTTKQRDNDFWKFENGEWSEILRDAKPPQRSGHAITYDQKNDLLVLFGGKNNDGQLLNDTWTWDGQNWKQLLIEGPNERQSHRLIGTKDYVLLFGGSTQTAESLDDTWILQNDTWLKIESDTSPPARRQHTLAYDSIRNRVVLFGGFDRTNEGKIQFGDTWEFDGRTWEMAGNNPELARDHHAMNYHPGIQKTLLFGGYSQGYLGDTYAWDGIEWSLLSTNGPARAGKPGLMYDNKIESVILFGGGNSTSMCLMDFWKFDHVETNWIRID